VLRLDSTRTRPCNEIKIPGDQIIAIIETRPTPSERVPAALTSALESQSGIV